MGEALIRVGGAGADVGELGGTDQLSESVELGGMGESR